MYAKERQEKIKELINIEGSVKVKDLSLKYNVTEDCIRKDLAQLEKKGYLKKTYGGAVSVRINPHLYNSKDRKNTQNDERIIIAKKAYSLLKNGDTIFLDVSLSNLELAKLIVTSPLQITVITNMIDILNILVHSQVSVIFIGGELNNSRDAFWGTLSLQILTSFKIDKAFLGVVGIDTNSGQISTYHIDDGIMKAKAIEQSRYTYLLCEERKFKEDGNYIFSSLNNVYGIIVSKQTHQAQLNNYEIKII